MPILHTKKDKKYDCILSMTLYEIQDLVTSER